MVDDVPTGCGVETTGGLTTASIGGAAVMMAPREVRTAALRTGRFTGADFFGLRWGMTIQVAKGD
jgi:hypothetical protein